MCAGGATIQKRVCLVGAGATGISAGAVLKEQGFEAVIYDAADKVGGMWPTAYDGAVLQNVYFQYHLKDYSFADAGIKASEHPTKEQIVQYFEAAAQHKKLDIRLQHKIESTERTPDGKWTVKGTRSDSGSSSPFEEVFDQLMVCTGLFDRPVKTPLNNRDAFKGQVLNRQQYSPALLQQLKAEGKTLAVVGFGKSAIDLATFAADAGVVVKHVFKAPRWAVPNYLGGVNSSWALFTRINTIMIPSWGFPTAGERFLHKHLSWLVAGFWSMISVLVWAQFSCPAWFRGREARARMALVKSKDPFTSQFRNAVPVEPPGYSTHIATGAITPVSGRGAVTGFTEAGLVLSSGVTVAADCVLLCLGNEAPEYPFLPKAYRELLEAPTGGAQLYRHCIHPDLPGLLLNGINHGLLHMPMVELSTLWWTAVLRGELLLPSREEQLAVIERVRTWKAEHVLFERALNCGVNARFIQYIDTLCLDLGVSPVRRPFPLSLFVRIGCSDYAGIVQEYQALQKRNKGPRTVQAIDM